MKTKHCFFVIIACSCIMSCLNKTREAEAEADYADKPDSVETAADTLQLYEVTPEPDTADELFLDFFFRFTTDEAFQLRRIRFPLSLTDDRDEERISRAQWTERNPFDNQEFYSVIYDREHDITVQNDTSLHHVKVWWILLGKDEQVGFDFHKIDGQWLLTDCSRIATSQTAIAGFIDFFSHFCADTLHQTEFIQFPLKLVSVPDEDVEENVTEELSEADWEELRHELPLPSDVLACIDYGQPMLSQNRKIMMLEGLSSGLFIKYRFDHTNGSWKLYEINN